MVPGPFILLHSFELSSRDEPLMTDEGDVQCFVGQERSQAMKPI